MAGRYSPAIPAATTKANRLRTPSISPNSLRSSTRRAVIGVRIAWLKPFPTAGRCSPRQPSGATISVPSPPHCYACSIATGRWSWRRPSARHCTRGVPHPNAVRLSLQRRREQREQDPPLPVTLPEDLRVRNLVVRPHDLNDYDQLQARPELDDDHNQ